jgi:hypothetical protein
MRRRGGQGTARPTQAVARKSEITKRTHFFWRQKDAKLTMVKQLASIYCVKTNWVRLASFGGSPECARARQWEKEGAVAFPSCPHGRQRRARTWLSALRETGESRPNQTGSNQF